MDNNFEICRCDLNPNLNMVPKQAWSPAFRLFAHSRVTSTSQLPCICIFIYICICIWSPVWRLFAAGRVTAETTCPLDTLSSLVRANMLSPRRFEITDFIKLSRSNSGQSSDNWTVIQWKKSSVRIEVGRSWYMLPGIALNCLIGKCPAQPVIYSFTSCCTPPHTTQKLLLGLGM